MVFDPTPLRDTSDAPVGAIVLSVTESFEEGDYPEEDYLLDEATGETLDAIVARWPDARGSMWTPIDEESSRQIATFGRGGWSWSL